LRHRYTFDLDRRTTDETPGGRNTTHIGWSGALELTYLGCEGGQHLFSGRVVPARLEADPALDDEARRNLLAMFKPPLYVAQDVRGRVLSVHFDAGQDATARRLVRTLLAVTQFVAEEGGRWSTEETDASGDFESEYHAGGSANTYVKTKRRYLRGAPGATVPPRTRGHLDFTLFEDGHVREVTGSEVVESGHLREETRVAMTCVGVDTHELPLKRFQEARAGLRAEALSATEPAGPHLDAKDARLEALAAQLTKRQPPEARAQTHARLAALFRTKPAEAEQAARWVRQGTAGAALTGALLEALGRAGTPEAQRALASVLEASRVRLETRAQAAKAAGGVERPTAELAEALTRLVDAEERVRDTATLSLGAIARTLALREPEQGSRLVDELLEHCGAKKVATEVCLRALARSGSPRGLAYAKAALSHRSPEVRGAATEALRAIPGAEPDALLDRVLLGDEDPRVRAQAAVAISQRVAGPHMQAAAKVLRDEPSEGVRLEVVRMLGGLRPVDPAAEALLRDAAENDPAASVRRVAASLLEG
ncbi:MAG TPA: HEAT repeat domain-containing protein, partial [Myxococcus sp.]|nr:HEAT repeat domain-containing protein [Myxococcus sp.]